MRKLGLLIILQLLRRLHSVNEKLKKFSHVNKKAFEQFGQFTKQRDQLTHRKGELDKTAEVNKEKKKDEWIEAVLIYFTIVHSYLY